MIFKSVGDVRPYPEHGYSAADWSRVPIRQMRLADITTTRRLVDLEVLLADDSTFYGDLYIHVVKHGNSYYLEDGTHRAVRAALQQRLVIHARVLDLDAISLTGGHAA